MDLLDLLGLLLLAATAWLWLDSIRVREMAVLAAKAACNAERLLLLDDTVAIQRVGLARDGAGTMRLKRIYAFEYSDTGNDRMSGNIAMLGARVLAITLNWPHGRQ